MDAGITLSPLRTEVEVAPGTSQDRSLSITNNNQIPITVHLSAESFRVINDNYDYAFDQETGTSDWITFNQASFLLQKGEARVITYTIGVPLMAEPGGRYVSLFVSADADESGDVVSSRQRVGSLLYMTVLGDATRLGDVIALKAPFFVLNSGQEWSTSIRNGGSTHFRTRYNVNVQNIFGGESVMTQTGTALILPGTIRRVADTMPVPPLPGIYRLQYTIGLGDTPGYTETKYVLFVSPVIIVVSLLAIILILALIFQGKRNINVTNRSGERPYKERQ
jgi:hypothetical protein